MWKLGSDCLPNRQRLSSKGVECQENCVGFQTYTLNTIGTYSCVAMRDYMLEGTKYVAAHRATNATG
ncbi:hypothetical protein P8452_03271 [Trifolium repens]|nr:hypothetical protein P8452_03271 [Trifolium repens]